MLPPPLMLLLLLLLCCIVKYKFSLWCMAYDYTEWWQMPMCNFRSNWTTRERERQRKNECEWKWKHKEKVKVRKSRRHRRYHSQQYQHNCCSSNCASQQCVQSISIRLRFNQPNQSFAHLLFYCCYCHRLLATNKTKMDFLLFLSFRINSFKLTCQTPLPFVFSEARALFPIPKNVLIYLSDKYCLKVIIFLGEKRRKKCLILCWFEWASRGCMFSYWNNNIYVGTSFLKFQTGVRG